MTTPLLVLDCHYLCHRAFHAQRDLSWKGIATGVIFGFMKSLRHLKHQFMTDRIAFCFESPVIHRKKDFPDYKKRRGREKEEPERKKARSELCRQIEALRLEYLPTCGFRNIFYEHGFESDDVMAVISNQATLEEPVILVTSDADLYQCLRYHRVQIFSPHKNQLMSERWFRDEFGIAPPQWAMVKAIAGCGTDEVPGIEGVGEVTALKFLRNQLPHHSPVLAKIIGPYGRSIVRRNRKLVELPYPGCPVPKIQKDELDLTGWETVCHNLGFKSLVDMPPIFRQQMLF